MEHEKLEALWAEQDRKRDEVLKWIRLFMDVQTEFGVGQVVELRVKRYNGLYYEKESVEAVVWYGTNHPEARVIWSTHPLYEISKVEKSSNKLADSEVE